MLGDSVNILHVPQEPHTGTALTLQQLGVAAKDGLIGFVVLKVTEHANSKLEQDGCRWGGGRAEVGQGHGAGRLRCPGVLASRKGKRSLRQTSQVEMRLHASRFAEMSVMESFVRSREMHWSHEATSSIVQTTTKGGSQYLSGGKIHL